MIGYLLRLEWLKFKSYKPLRNSLILYLLLLPGLFLMGKQIQITTDNMGFLSNAYGFPTVWSSLGYAGNWLSFILLGFLAVVITTSELENKTWRQNVIDGLQRKDLFFSKITFLTTIALISTILYAASAIVFGIIHTDNVTFSGIFESVDFIPRYFLMCLGYMLFAFFLAIVVRKTGPTIIVYIAYILFLEPAIRWGLHKNILDNKSMHFYPMNAVEDLIPLPFQKQAKLFAAENEFDFILSPVEASICVLIFTAIFMFITYRRIEQSDL